MNRLSYKNWDFRPLGEVHHQQWFSTLTSFFLFCFLNNLKFQLCWILFFFFFFIYNFGFLYSYWVVMNKRKYTPMDIYNISFIIGGPYWCVNPRTVKEMLHIPIIFRWIDLIAHLCFYFLFFLLFWFPLEKSIIYWPTNILSSLSNGYLKQMPKWPGPGAHPVLN